MARIVQCGFELGTVLQIGVDNQNAGTVTIVGATPTARSGAYCCKCMLTSTANVAWASKKIAHAGASEVYYAFGAYFNLPAELAVDGFFRVHDGSGNMQMQLTYDAGTIAAYAYTAATNSYTANGSSALLGSAAAVAAQNTWHLIEVRYIPHVSAGTLTVWVNGVQVINATGVRTAFATGPIVDCELVLCRLNGGFPPNSGVYVAYDDLRINDTTGTRNNGRLFDEAIRLLVPTGAGDLTQLSRGGVDSGANWSQVDEVPPSAGTDYVAGTTAGLTDLYNTNDLAVTSVSAVQVWAQVANPDGGGSVNLVTKTGAGQSDGSAYPLTVSWTIVSRLLETDPAGGAAWDQAKLNALQLGVKTV